MYMKSIRILSLALVLLLAACSANRSVESVVISFVEAFEAQDWEAAKALSTEESVAMIDAFRGFTEMVGDDAEPFSFEVVKDSTMVDGEEAHVTIVDENNNPITYRLVKVDGDWKMDFTMEALMGDILDESAEEVQESIDDMGEKLDEMGDMIDDAMEEMEDLMDDLDIDADELEVERKDAAH